MRAPSAGMAARVCSGHLLLPWHPSKQMALHPIPKQLLPPPLQNMPSPPCPLPPPPTPPAILAAFGCKTAASPSRQASPCLLTHLLIPGPPVCHTAAPGSRPASPPSPLLCRSHCFRRGPPVPPVSAEKGQDLTAG